MDTNIKIPLNFFYIKRIMQLQMPYGIVLHTPPTNYHILAAKQYTQQQKIYLLTKNIGELLSGEKSQESGPVSRKKRQNRKSNWSMQKNMTGDSKVE